MNLFCETMQREVGSQADFAFVRALRMSGRRCGISFLLAFALWAGRRDFASRVCARQVSGEA